MNNEIEINEGRLEEKVKILSRMAWIDTEKNRIVDVKFYPRKNYKKIRVTYPAYVAGTRCGEAKYVHLPSNLDSLVCRIKSAN